VHLFVVMATVVSVLGITALLLIRLDVIQGVCVLAHLNARNNVLYDGSLSCYAAILTGRNTDLALPSVPFGL